MKAKKATKATTATIDVQVRLMGDLPSVVGVRDLTVSMAKGKTVGDLLAVLSDKFGEAFVDRVFDATRDLQHTVVVFVNGENIKDQGGFSTELDGGDVEVVMLPMFGGG